MHLLRNPRGNIPRITKQLDAFAATTGLETKQYQPNELKPVGDDAIYLTWNIERDCKWRDKKRHIVMEQGYIRDRLEYLGIGVGGLNGDADFLNENSPPDRWQKHGVEVKPWNTDGEYIVIMGQVKGDAQVRNVDIEKWYTDTYTTLKEKYPGVDVYFRPHPMTIASQQTRPRFDGVMVGISDRTRRVRDRPKTTLQECLDGAMLAVAYNSNSLVDAVLNGTPAAAGAPCVARSAVSYDYSIITPDREQWCNDLAYCNWSHDEIASGEAWDHIKKGFTFLEK